MPRPQRQRTHEALRPQCSSVPLPVLPIVPMPIESSTITLYLYLFANSTTSLRRMTPLRLRQRPGWNPCCESALTQC